MVCYNLLAPLTNLTPYLDINTAEPPEFKVQVEGLDEAGVLSAKKGDEHVITGKLISKSAVRMLLHKLL